MHTLPHIDHGMHIVKMQIAEQPQQVQRLVQAVDMACVGCNGNPSRVGQTDLMAGQTGRQIAMKVKDHI